MDCAHQLAVFLSDCPLRDRIVFVVWVPDEDIIRFDLEGEEKVDFIVDCGVCILERKEDKTQLVARLREPMVVQAYLEYI